MDRRKLRETTEVVADAGWHLERASWRSIEQELIDAPRVEVLAYVDYAAYDGVDLKLTTKNFWKRVRERAPVAGMLQDAGDVEKLLLELQSKQPVEEQLGMAKILHSKQYVGMALRIDETEVCYLIGAVGSLLLGMDRSTGEGILGSILRQEVGGVSRETVKRKTRLNESDSAGHNERAERGLLDLRPGWQGLTFKCEVHYTSGTHAKAYAVTPGDVTGMISTTLAKRDFGTLVFFGKPPGRPSAGCLSCTARTSLSSTAERTRFGNS